MSIEISWKDKGQSEDNNITLTENDNLKSLIVEYVGSKVKPQDDQINVSMVIEMLAKEFPEVVLCLAEENWYRGYEQGLEDTEEFGK
jgi:hypothetical protein